MGSKKLTKNKKVKPFLDMYKEEFREIRRSTRDFLNKLKDIETNCENKKEFDVLLDKTYSKLQEFDWITQQLYKFRKYYNEMYKEFIEIVTEKKYRIERDCIDKQIEKWENKITDIESVKFNKPIIIMKENEKNILRITKTIKENNNKKPIIITDTIKHPIYDSIIEFMNPFEYEFLKKIRRIVNENYDNLKDTFIVIENVPNKTILNSIIELLNEKKINSIILTNMEVQVNPKLNDKIEIINGDQNGVKENI